MSPLDLEGGVDVILGWDWIVSHDLKKLYSLGEMVAEGPNGTVRIPIERRRATPDGGQAMAQTVGGQAGGDRLIGHRAFERLIGQPYAEEEQATVATVTGVIKSGMWSRPLHAIGEEEDERRPGRWRGMRARNAVRRALLEVGAARMVDGTELHLLHMRPEDDKLTLAGKDHPAMAEVLLRHKGVFDDPPPGLPPDRGIELCLNTGDRPMPPSRPVERLSARELTELDCQLHDLYKCCWMECSTAGHATAVVFENPTGHGDYATTTGGSTPSRSRSWSPYSTLTPYSSRRGGLPCS